MTKQEVNKLLALMKANYSYAFKNMSQQDKHLLLNTWTFTLQDINADVVMIAAMQLISESKWLPTVAEIRKKCQDLYYSASYRDKLFERLSENGHEFSAKEIAAQDRQEKAYEYIMSATGHLRGDKTPELKLDNILRNPSFAGLGSGQSSFEMLEGAQYELTDGYEEGNYE